MKAPMIFPNIYSLLDLLPSQADERVDELMGIPQQRPRQPVRLWLPGDENDNAVRQFEVIRAASPFWAAGLAGRDLY